MWISIRARRMTLRPRLRKAIEDYIARALASTRPRVASVVVYLTPAIGKEGNEEFACRLVVWSPDVGQVAVNRIAPRIGQSIRQAAQRTRQLMRSRAKKWKTRHRWSSRHRDVMEGLLWDEGISPHAAYDKPAR